MEVVSTVFESYEPQFSTNSIKAWTRKPTEESLGRLCNMADPSSIGAGIDEVLGLTHSEISDRRPIRAWLERCAVKSFMNELQGLQITLTELQQ